MQTYSKYMRADAAKNLIDIGCKATDDSMFGHLLRYGNEGAFETEKVPNPTGAPTGSREKINLIVERLKRGEELFHDGDNQTACKIEEDELTRFEMAANAEKLRDEKRDAREAIKATKANKKRKAKVKK